MAINAIKPLIKRKYPETLDRFLPRVLIAELSVLDDLIVIEEIRMRKNAPCSLSTNFGNIVLSSVLTPSQMKDTLVSMSGHSLYAHSETINSGYLTLEGGIRVGICGRATVSGGCVTGVYDISALNVRIPRPIFDVGERVCSLLRTTGNGVLVYSPPGVGKTTLLRSVAYRMASGERPIRVSVIDSRGELGIQSFDSSSVIDLLSGYPKAIGIEIAVRTMNPELLVCDEIGDEKEAMAIIGAQNCGVPLLASAHAGNIAGLLKRTGILALHKASVFGAYVGIERVSRQSDYKYTVHTAKEAERYL